MEVIDQVIALMKGGAELRYGGQDKEGRTNFDLVHVVRVIPGIVVGDLGARGLIVNVRDEPYDNQNFDWGYKLKTPEENKT